MPEWCRFLGSEKGGLLCCPLSCPGHKRARPTASRQTTVSRRASHLRVVAEMGLLQIVLIRHPQAARLSCKPRHELWATQFASGCHFWLPSLPRRSCSPCSRPRRQGSMPTYVCTGLRFGFSRVSRANHCMSGHCADDSFVLCGCYLSTHASDFPIVWATLDTAQLHPYWAGLA